MPYIANTPESSPGIKRTDSRDPSTTCHGITCNGRRCKRSLPRKNRTRLLSVDESALNNAPVPESGNFCWQHKDQAQQTAMLRQAASYDSLIERLSVLNIQKPRQRRGPSPSRNRYRNSRNRQTSHSSKGQRYTSLFSRLCCIGSADQDDDKLEVVRHCQTRKQGSFPEVAIMRSHTELLSHSSHTAQSSSSEAKSRIPQSLAPETRAQLQAELSKPISSFDEHGYIYVFRQVVPKTRRVCVDAPPLDSNIQSDRSGPRPRYDLAQEPKELLGQDKILVKIGCTKNVQSRLSAWSGKCGSKVELLRYYPHHPSHSDPTLPRKTPNCHRVERLIHIELADSRVRQKCACGSIHREWFEIDASAKAVKAVDEVIRKWVSWAEDGRQFDRTKSSTPTS